MGHGTNVAETLQRHPSWLGYGTRLPVMPLCMLPMHATCSTGQQIIIRCASLRHMDLLPEGINILLLVELILLATPACSQLGSPEHVCYNPAARLQFSQKFW